MPLLSYESLKGAFLFLDAKMKFEDLIKRLSPKLKGITKKIGSEFSFFDNEDLYQEALLHLWEGWNKDEFCDKTDSFILQGCFFFLKNYVRKTCKKIDFRSVSFNNSFHEKDVTLEEMLSSDDASSPADFTKCKLLIENICNRITKKEKDVFVLSLQDWTTREIGQKLGISHVMVVKIKKRIKRNCRDLREEIYFT